MVPSPCRDICRIDQASGYCVGCGRTLDEITSWPLLDNDAKRSMWALLPARLLKFECTAAGRGEPADRAS